MGLMNARNLRKAKQLLEKNRHKMGDIVEKAGTQLDKASKGKTSNVTAKAADAARKYSEGGVTHHGVDSPGPAFDDPAYKGDTEAMRADARVREAQATAGAANAVKGAADALTNLMNKAAATAEAKNVDGAAKQKGAPDDGIQRDEFD